MRHNGGLTFNIIRNELELCGYNIWHKVLEVKDFGLP
ncbi:MAG TPA: hypothetical protein GX401_09275 [Clostridiales bacterium]|nr:hypothetical protein [Clostridiales bacterium]